ncbi:hypothetical protein EYV94_18150 [Puteibacter caeruleilacunae]|nr:hypothetical protein EYV94_18150 [Puteibacter caeruleilacunae]
MDLYTNIFLVFTTSSSIATWAIWKEMPLLWAGIIAISQIVTLAKPYLLFPKYVKVFYERNLQWQNISLEIEELWHKLENSIIEESVAAKEYFDLRKKSLIFDKVSEDIIFFDYTRLQDKAEELCNFNIQKLYNNE